MDYWTYLFGNSVVACDEDAPATLPPNFDMEKHKRRFHPNGLKEGDTCKYVDLEKQEAENEGENLSASSPDTTPNQFKKECDEIKKKYINTDKWMRAPNGEYSNLDDQLWIVVRTPSFKKWFGDWENDPENASKVVDRNGEPLVVYHGSEDATINNLYDVFWTSENRETAQCYTRGRDDLPLTVERKPIPLSKKDWERIYRTECRIYLDEDVYYDGTKCSNMKSLGSEQTTQKPHGNYIPIDDIENVIDNHNELDKYKHYIHSHFPVGNLECVDGIFYDDSGNEFKTSTGTPVDKSKFSKKYVLRLYDPSEKTSPIELNSMSLGEFKSLMFDRYKKTMVGSIRGRNESGLSDIEKKFKQYIIAENPEAFSKGGLYSVFARANNIMHLDCAGMVYDNIHLPSNIKHELGFQSDRAIGTDDVALAARDKGYDAVCFHKITDASTIATPLPDNVWCFMNASGNVKSVKNKGLFSNENTLMN